MLNPIPWNPADARLPEHVDPVERQFQQLKSEIHQTLIESLDLSKVGQSDRERLSPQVRQLADRVFRARRDALSKHDRERLLDELLSEVFGLGPLEKLMQDSEITDILVNGPYTVYIERRGQLELTDIVFADDDHLLRIIQRISARMGRRIDEASPMVDARLPDGSRVNAVIPPLALDGPSVSIRRFGAQPLEMDDLLGLGSLLPEMAEFLDAAIEARVGTLISGGTGAGKTTLLNALSRAIPPGERLVTIEDSAELILQHRHRVRLETRPANSENRGEVTQRELVRNSLRMRPDRIIVGEVRGAEVWDMLQAMNTGHEGSLTTIHANSSEDALARLEMMVAMTGFDLPINVVRHYIASGIKLVVHGARLKGGPRRIMAVSEITGIKDNEYQLQHIFRFHQTGLDAEGRAAGYFEATGCRPQCLERIEAAGVRLPSGLFEPRRLSEPPPAARDGEAFVSLEEDSHGA